MDVYKDFVYGLRKIEYETPFLIIIREHPPNHLENYVKMIEAVPFEDTTCNAYYGEIKRIVFSFFNFYQTCIARINDKIDLYNHELKYEDMMEMYNKTLSIYDDRFQSFQRDCQPRMMKKCNKTLRIYDDRLQAFRRGYQLGDSVSEEMRFNVAVAEYQEFRKKLVDFGAEIAEIKKPENIHKFTKAHLPICIEKTAAMCDYGHVFISKMIFARVDRIRVSIQDILIRIRKNSKDFDSSYETKLNALYNKLYDLNKERLSISRRQTASPTDIAEVDKKIDMVRHQIEHFGNFETLNRLKVETEYWSKRLKEFEYITSIIIKVKDPLDKMTKEEQIFEKYRTTEMDGSKATCWGVIGENFKHMKADLEAKYTRACRPLITFFTCRGVNRIMYSDFVGVYFIDEYDHQNYVTNYGAKVYHVKCDGSFVENFENDKYYFDENGRYILENGEKIFQLAPCSNKYKRTQEGLLYTYEKCHCRHKCSTNDLNCSIKYLTDVVILPKTEQIDIRNTLDSDTVLYLWKSFGWILPEVLYQVGIANSKNPIHYFGHMLLNKKYTLTEKEIKEMKAESKRFFLNIANARKEAARKLTLAWKAKQAQPCKAADLDTTDQDMAITAHQVGQQFIRDLNFYNF